MEFYTLIIIIIIAVGGIGLFFWLCSSNNCCFEAPLTPAAPRTPRIRTREERRFRSTPVSDEDAKRLHDEKKEAQHKQVVVAQNEILLRGLQTSEMLKCGLIIGVDARPKWMGGYCIDLRNRKCQAYAYKTDKLPWVLHDQTFLGDSDEFEMKNFLFALLLWEETIANEQVRIYTDNNAINNRKNDEGKRVRKFLNHLKNCRQVSIMNPEIHANRVKNIDCFAKYVQPADDLSRFRVYECKQFLKEVYGLNEFECSYSQDSSNSRMEKNNRFYASYLNTVKDSVERWKISPCPTCGFDIPDTGSLHSIFIDVRT